MADKPKGEISFGNSVHQGIVLRLLAIMAAREQFDETVESAVERDLGRGGCQLGSLLHVEFRHTPAEVAPLHGIRA
jgi:hypothetical protein